MSEGILLVNVKGTDLFSLGEVIMTVVPWLFLGCTLCHLVLLNQSFWLSSQTSFAVNLVGMILSGGVGIIIHGKIDMYNSGGLRQIGKIIQKGPHNRITAVDKSDWLFHYSHPVLKKHPNFPAVISKINSMGSNIRIVENRERKESSGNTGIVDLRDFVKVEENLRTLQRSQSLLPEELLINRGRVEKPLPPNRFLYESVSDGEGEEKIKDIIKVKKLNHLRDQHIRPGGVKLKGYIRVKTMNPFNPRQGKPVKLEDIIYEP